MTTAIVIIFCVGYCLIACEHWIKINKTATALLTGIFCWTIYIAGSPDKKEISRQLIEHTGNFSGILFFLMGAMTIVELISSHDGFKVITDAITTRKKRALLWIISIVAFFLSSVLDNLTTTIVMVSLVSKLLQEKNDRMLFAGMIVIAANAGGAWTPIGDVTTTMLWIGGNISTTMVLYRTFLPSIFCIIVPLILCTFSIHGSVAVSTPIAESMVPRLKRNIVFFSGIGVLLFVPVFKTITHLPPFMGILFGVGVLWVVVELLHRGETNEVRHPFSVTTALRNIDMPSVMFFLGILVAISALESSGILIGFATIIDNHIQSRNLVVFITGIISAVIDNVPLVAAFMGMYDLTRFPIDHDFWIFLAYCAGTGGSLLVIGSAAGVVAMGLAKLEFFWYIRKISFLAFTGYLAGALCYIWFERIWG
jgi:Na+/H+ antiporter NhaD/arsenite permease-like protein